MKRRIAFKAVDGNARSVAPLPLDFSDNQFSMVSGERQGLAWSKTPRISNISRLSPRSITKDSPQQRPPKPTGKKRQRLRLQLPILQNQKRSRNSTGSVLNSPAVRMLPSPHLDKYKHPPLLPDNRNATPHPRLKPHGHRTEPSTPITTRNNERYIPDGQENEKQNEYRQTDNHDSPRRKALKTNFSRQNQAESDEDMDCNSSVDSCFTSSSSSSSSSPSSLEKESNTLPPKRSTSVATATLQNASIPPRQVESNSNPSKPDDAKRRYQSSVSAPATKLTDVLNGIEDTAIDNEDVFQMMMNSVTTRAPIRHSPDADSILKKTIGNEHFTPYKPDDDSDITFLSLDGPSSLSGPKDQRTTQEVPKRMEIASFERSLDHNDFPSSKTQKAKHASDDIPSLPIHQHRARQGDAVLDVDIPDDGSITAWSIAGCMTSPFEFEIDGMRYIHEPLPHGYKVKISKTQKRPIYLHPERAPSWYCPVVLKGNAAYRKMGVAELKARKVDAPGSAGSSVFENRTRQTPRSPPSPQSSPLVPETHKKCGYTISTAPSVATRPTEEGNVETKFEYHLANTKASRCTNSERPLSGEAHQGISSTEDPEIVDDSHVPTLSGCDKERATPVSMSELVNRYEHDRKFPVHQCGYDCDISESLQSCGSSSSKDSWLQDSGKSCRAGSTKSSKIVSTQNGSKLPLSPVIETSVSSYSGTTNDGKQQVGCGSGKDEDGEEKDFMSGGSSATACTPRRATTAQMNEEQLLRSKDSMISETVSMKSENNRIESDSTTKSSRTSSASSSRPSKSSIRKSHTPESAVLYEDFTSLRHADHRRIRDRPDSFRSSDFCHGGPESMDDPRMKITRRLPESYDRTVRSEDHPIKSQPVFDDEWSPPAQQPSSLMVLTIGDLESKENALDVSALTSLCDTEAPNSNQSSDLKAKDTVREGYNIQNNQKLASFGHVLWKSPNCSGISRASDEDSPTVGVNVGLGCKNSREAITVLRSAHDLEIGKLEENAEGRMNQFEQASPKQLSAVSELSQETLNCAPPDKDRIAYSDPGGMGKENEDISECDHNIEAQQATAVEPAKSSGVDRRNIEALVHGSDNEKCSQLGRQTSLQMITLDSNNSGTRTVEIGVSKNARAFINQKTVSIAQDPFGAPAKAGKIADRDENFELIHSPAVVDTNASSVQPDMSSTREDGNDEADEHQTETESPVDFGTHYQDDSDQSDSASQVSFRSPTIGQGDNLDGRHHSEQSRREASRSYDDQSTDTSSRDSKHDSSTTNFPEKRQGISMSPQSPIENNTFQSTNSPEVFARDGRRDGVRKSRSLSIESLGVRTYARRRHSWRALNPPHPICSLQRLAEIVAERKRLDDRAKRAKWGKRKLLRTPSRTKRNSNRDS